MEGGTARRLSYGQHVSLMDLFRPATRKGRRPWLLGEITDAYPYFEIAEYHPTPCVKGPNVSSSKEGSRKGSTDGTLSMS